MGYRTGMRLLIGIGVAVFVMTGFLLVSVYRKAPPLPEIKFGDAVNVASLLVNIVLFAATGFSLWIAVVAYRAALDSGTKQQETLEASVQSARQQQQILEASRTALERMVERAEATQVTLEAQHALIAAQVREENERRSWRPELQVRINGIPEKQALAGKFPPGFNSFELTFEHRNIGKLALEDGRFIAVADPPSVKLAEPSPIFYATHHPIEMLRPVPSNRVQVDLNPLYPFSESRTPGELTVNVSLPGDVKKWTVSYVYVGGRLSREPLALTFTRP